MGLALAPHANDDVWWASAALDIWHIWILAYNLHTNGIVGWQHCTTEVASSSTLANQATAHKSTIHLPFYMAHNLTLSIFLVLNLANPLSTAKLIAAWIHQLQRRENDLVVIHANMGH